jgi:hypothetical protein
VNVKKNNSACRYDDIKGNESITQFLNLAKKQRMTIAKLSFDDKLKDGYRSFDLLNKVPNIEEKKLFCNATKLRHSVSSLQDRTFFLTSNRGILHGESLI